MELRVSRESGLKLYSKLAALETKYHEDHVIRHPADILKSSVEKLCTSLDELITTRKSNGLDKNKEKAICDHVLELDSFYDRLYLIMKGLSPTGDSDNKDATLWLKENNNEAYVRFKGSTAKAHAMIRKMSNGIKHDSLSIEYLTVVDYRNRKVDSFYFAKTVGQEELQGPCQDIHQEYKGSSTAISYDYFIRLSAGFVATCLFHLDKIFLNKMKAAGVRFDSLYQFFYKQKDVGDLILPNEYNAEMAEFKVENISIVIKFPSKEKSNKDTDKIVNIQPFFKINGRTNSSNNQWPYFKLLTQ